ncbi:chlorohydrolase [Streptococcus pneumoniae]|nr:chlorohydrolase [Streptococcus pneumoniae]
MNTIERTRRLVKGCATHCFEVVDRTETSAAISTASDVTWFAEIFEEY